MNRRPLDPQECFPKAAACRNASWPRPRPCPGELTRAAESRCEQNALPNALPPPTPPHRDLCCPVRQLTPAYPPPLLLPRPNFRYQRGPAAPARACQIRPRGTPGPDANRADHDHQRADRGDGEPIMVPRWQARRSRSERMKIGHTRSSSPSGGDDASRRSQRATIRREAKRRARPSACRPSRAGHVRAGSAYRPRPPAARPIDAAQDGVAGGAAAPREWACATRGYCQGTTLAHRGQRARGNRPGVHHGR